MHQLPRIQEPESDERSRRRTDHRRRRLGRRVRLEPGRHADAHPVPGTGRLDEPGRLPEHPARLGVARRYGDFSPRPQRARAPARLSGQRRRFADLGRSTSMASAAAPSCTPRTSRACIRRTSGSARSTAWPTTGRSTIRRSSPSTPMNDRIMGVAGLAGDPAYPPHEPPLPPVPLGRWARRWRAASTGWAGTGGRPTARSPRASYEGRDAVLNLGPA